MIIIEKLNPIPDEIKENLHNLYGDDISVWNLFNTKKTVSHLVVYDGIRAQETYLGMEVEHKEEERAVWEVAWKLWPGENVVSDEEQIKKFKEEWTKEREQFFESLDTT